MFTLWFPMKSKRRVILWILNELCKTLSELILLSLFLPGVLCGRQCDQGFFQFALKTAKRWSILCHVLKPGFAGCLLALHSLFDLLPFPNIPFVSETAASFPSTKLSALVSFTLITFPVLQSVSQTVCPTLVFNQHKSIPAPSFQ